MTIREFLIDIDEPSHLVDHVIHDTEGLGDISAEGDNGMGQLFAADLLVNGYATL